MAWRYPTGWMMAPGRSDSSAAGNAFDPVLVKDEVDRGPPRMDVAGLMGDHPSKVSAVALTAAYHDL